MQTFNSKIIKKMRWKYFNKNLNKSHNSPILWQRIWNAHSKNET